MRRSLASQSPRQLQDPPRRAHLAPPTRNPRTNNLHHPRQQPYYHWVPARTVCRHWYHVALECPSFWGQPLFKSAACAKEMPRRSQMSSLVVKADVNGQSETALVQLAIHRTRVLDLAAPQKLLQQLLA